MTISVKNRKLLWGNSGKRCAICKRELVVVSDNENDDDSIIGEECHIISSKKNGPRHCIDYPKDKFDSYDNIILLCRNHHKMVDDQYKTYTVDVLHQIKANLEKWVSQRLKIQPEIVPVKIKQIKENIPAFLHRIFTGKELFNIVDSTSGYLFDYDELESQNEVEVVSEFLQDLKDIGEISSNLEPQDKIRYTFELKKRIELLEKQDFFIFGCREVRRIEGGYGVPEDFPVAVIKILKKTNVSIIKVKFNA